VTVRGHGRVPQPALAYKTIRNYLAYLLPLLTGWASRYASLREVTRQDILDAVHARHGPVIQHRVVALRSLFRALRQERPIFRDPTRGISLPAPARLPLPLPADRVAGLLDRADGPAARLAVALVAIHALPEADLVRLQAADLDLASCTLTVRRGHQRRIIYLDEVTAALASQWLRYRHQRWPDSRNPHLRARSCPIACTVASSCSAWTLSSCARESPARRCHWRMALPTMRSGTGARSTAPCSIMLLIWCVSPPKKTAAARTPAVATLSIAARRNGLCTTAEYAAIATGIAAITFGLPTATSRVAGFSSGMIAPAGQPRS
jgi:hypothetical protein